MGKPDAEQAALDAEDAEQFRQSVRALADRVRQQSAEVHRQKRKLIDARKECGYANRLLASLSEGMSPATAWMQNARKALKRVEQARETEIAVRQEWGRARFALSVAREKLRERWQAQFSRYPLFEE